MKVFGMKALVVLMVLSSVLFSPALFAADTTPVGDSYPLATDPVTGNPLGDKPVVYLHEGRELRFAGEASLEQFKKEPKPVLEKLDKTIIEQQIKTYALDKCPVGGEELGGMGETVDFVYNNRLVRLCCGGCRKSVAKKPADIFAKLDQAVIAKQAGDYAVKTCVVTGDALPAKPVDLVIGSRLVRLCCSDCADAVKKDPAKYLARIDEAKK